ncbi:chemotaxis protein CheW [Trinickia sp. LjRoot230]|uniref:chemotaxis protein CheW n=1 Tax=Trinickia sp. LjRoot230 TaxID=3342288 RepID=UPI003ECE3EBE
MAHGALEKQGALALVDDCWNRIGTRGDGSCPRLAEHARCPNCPVFEQAAAALLDRSPGNLDLAETASVTQAAFSDEQAGTVRRERAGVDPSTTHSALVFLIADEWLALPTAALRQVDDVRPIHPLPHRLNQAVLGLVNIRGALTVAASLGELLHLDRAAAGRHGGARNGYARMLVAAHRGEPVAFPVDEVEGVLRFAASALMPLPATLAHAIVSHTRGVLAWRDKTIGLLDTDRVFDSLVRSLR